MSGTLDGRRILVTGGASGIGAAISEALLEASAQVMIVQRTASELEDALLASGLAGRVEAIAADLGLPGECERAVAETIRRFGGLDGLVNNAAVTGPPAHRGVLEIDDAYLDHLVDVNLKAVVRCTAAAARHMAEHGGGVIVSTASVLAHAPAPAAAAYSATKAAVIAFTRGVALELGPRGIRALTVSPGDIATASSIAPPAESGQRAVREAALGRRGTTGEIGAVVRFLLGPDAAYLTGSDVLVDGGFLLT